MTEWRLTGFLCETTLTDQNQQISIIGIMPGRVTLNSVPSPIALGAFVRVSPLPPPGTPIKIEMFLGDVKVVDAEMASVASPPDAANEFGLDALHINIAKIVLMLNEPTVLKLLVAVADSDPELVSALRVTIASPPDEKAPAPPTELATD